MAFLSRDPSWKCRICVHHFCGFLTTRCLWLPGLFNWKSNQLCLVKCLPLLFESLNGSLTLSLTRSLHKAMDNWCRVEWGLRFSSLLGLVALSWRKFYTSDRVGQRPSVTVNQGGCLSGEGPAQGHKQTLPNKGGNKRENQAWSGVPRLRFPSLRPHAKGLDVLSFNSALQVRSCTEVKYLQILAIYHVLKHKALRAIIL